MSYCSCLNVNEFKTKYFLLSQNFVYRERKKKDLHIYLAQVWMDDNVDNPRGAFREIKA